MIKTAGRDFENLCFKLRLEYTIVAGHLVAAKIFVKCCNFAHEADKVV